MARTSNTRIQTNASNLNLKLQVEVKHRAQSNLVLVFALLSAIRQSRQLTEMSNFTVPSNPIGGDLFGGNNVAAGTSGTNTTPQSIFSGSLGGVLNHTNLQFSLMVTLLMSLAKPATPSGGLFGGSATAGTGGGGLFGGGSLGSAPTVGGPFGGGAASPASSISFSGAGLGTNTTAASLSNSLSGGGAPNSSGSASIFGGGPSTGGSNLFSIPKSADQSGSAMPKPSSCKLNFRLYPLSVAHGFSGASFQST
jgi:hypothetical protein